MRVMTLFVSPVSGLLTVLMALLVLIPSGWAAMVTINWSTNETLALSTTINTGDIVYWVWGDSEPHSVKSTDESFTSSSIVQQMGYNYSYQFWGTGTFPYHCGIHSTIMSGTVNVVTSSGEPTPSPTAFTTPAPDLTTSYVAPKVVKSGQALSATWTLRLEIKMNKVYITDDISYNTRSFCYLSVCYKVGPTIQVKAGDVIKLIVQNRLGDNKNSSNPNFKQPNSTRFYIHGLHTDPFFQFSSNLPGSTSEIDIVIPNDQPTGIHWYSSDMPGAAELHTMNGLVGAIYVEPQRIDNVPFAIQNAAPFIMLVTSLVVKQETDTSGGDVTQGCSASSACSATIQSPLCTGNS